MKALHLAAELDLEGGGVELLNRRDAAATGAQAVPVPLDVEAKRVDRPQAGDDDAAGHFPPFSFSFSLLAVSRSMWSIASPTVVICSAWSSGMVISNSSSSSMTSSTMSSESAPTSSVKEVERVTCSLLTPRFSQTISITRSSTEGTIESSQSGPQSDRKR